MEVGQSRYSETNEILNKKLSEKSHLIAVHRGSPGGNIIENTIPAYKAAMAMGGDVLEIDVIKSKDGVLYTFHDGTEYKNLRRRKNIKKMSSKEIDSLYYYNSICHKNNYKVERFEDVIRFFSGEELFNIDRAWDIFPEVANMLEKYPDAKKQAILKSPVSKPILEFLNSYPEKFMYMPIVYNWDDIDRVLSYPDINIVGVEAIAKKDSDALFGEKAIKKVKGKNLFIWANAITLDDDTPLYGGLDDDISIKEDPSKGWGRLMDIGIDIIQTDWPALLYGYREQYLKGKGLA